MEFASSPGDLSGVLDLAHGTRLHWYFASPRTKQIAADQVAFYCHLNTVSGTLRDWSEGCLPQFGLPYNGQWRTARNYFSHSVLMPYKLIEWASTIQQIKKLHPELLTQVEKTYRAIEERLSDEEAWTEPEEKVEAEQDVDVFSRRRASLSRAYPLSLCKDCSWSPTFSAWWRTSQRRS